MRQHENLLELVAGLEFRRQFGELLSVRAKMFDFEYGLIVSLIGTVSLLPLDSEGRTRWDRSVRAAHYYLDRGALKRTREICESYARIADEIPPALNDVLRKRNAADKLMGDEWIEALLSLYKTMTEGLLTIIAAPVIVGFRHVYGAKESAFFPKPDGRVNLKAIELMEDWSVAPSNLLKEGLNKHVRNAFAHQRYRILDDEVIEMWDQTTQGKLTWGPERFAFSAIQELCDRLIVTCTAIGIALGIFGINYRQLMIDRGWIPADRVVRPLRFEEIRELIEKYAAFNSFTVVSVEKHARDLHLRVKTQSRGIDQTEEILIRRPGGPRAYNMQVRYEQKSVAEIVIGVLQRALGSPEELSMYRVEVANEEGWPLGQFEISTSALEKVGGPKTNDLRKDRSLAHLDTLGESEMWVRLEAAPRPL